MNIVRTSLVAVCAAAFAVVAHAQTPVATPSPKASPAGKMGKMGKMSKGKMSKGKMGGKMSGGKMAPKPTPSPAAKP